MGQVREGRGFGRNNEHITSDPYFYISILESENFIFCHDYINGAG